jgi:DNA polymerase-1
MIMTEKLMLLDGFSLANRAFFALPPLTTSSGIPTNAVYGMTMMLMRLLDESKPDYLLMAFDVAAPTFRHQEFEAYKGQRLKMEDSLKVQIPLIRQLAAVLKIPIIEEAGYEADDLIGTMAKKAARQGIEVEIITGDRDAFQLVQPGITVLYTRKGITEVDRVTEQYISDRYQLKPEQLIDLKSLMGDVSDNIPGVPGFGEKTALKYLHQYQTLTGIYQHLEEIAKERDRQLLDQYREQAYLSRHLAEIVTNINVETDPASCCLHQNYSKTDLLAFCKQFEFHTLVRKLSAGEVAGGELSGSEVETGVSQLPELFSECQVIQKVDIGKAVAAIHKEKRCYIQFFTNIANWAQVGFLGLGFGSATESWFYPFASGAELTAELADIFSDESITKCGHDLKKQLQILANLDIAVKGDLEDVLIAGYLVNAGLGGLELEELSAVHIQKTIQAWRNEKGKAFSVFNLPPDLPAIVLAKIAGGRLEAMRRLRPKLEELLSASGLTELFQTVESPLIQALFQMEREGIKVNPETLREFGRVLKTRQSQLETDIYSLVQEKFNISSPKQLGIILFEKLGLKAPKKTKTGYSTDAEVLEALADQHPVIPLILEYRQNTKLQTTYIDSLIALINPRSSRVHTTFNQAVTTTGRLSCTDPNLQNIPIRSEEGRLIRCAFIPTDERHRLLAADYSQIELRVMAHFSQDQAYKEAFLRGEDIHKYTAAAVHGVPVSEVTKEMRNQAKAVNFGIIYGISGFGLARNIGVSRKEADSFIAAYFEKYSGVKTYVEQLIEEARQTGEARTLLGRIRKLPDLHSRNFSLRSFAERMARNTPIQGTAADIIKKAMVAITRELNSRPGLGKLLLQVHDELIFEVEESNWRELAKMVKTEMENAVSLSVPLVVDLKMGSNWGEMSPLQLEE